MIPEYKIFSTRQFNRAERDQEMRKDRENGASLRELAETYGLMTESIKTILKTKKFKRPPHKFKVGGEKQERTAVNEKYHYKYTDGSTVKTKYYWKLWSKRQGYIVECETNSKEFTIINSFNNKIVKTLVRV